jgi:hypothetical protein
MYKNKIDKWIFERWIMVNETKFRQHTYWVDNEEVFVERFLALSELGGAHIPSPHAEGFPLAEQCERGDLADINSLWYCTAVNMGNGLKY